MTYSVSPGNIFGRIGTNIGKGLAESIPREAERYRLAQGLKDLESQKGLTPFQQYSRLAAIPGVTPQILQGGSELLRQQSYLDALKNQYEGQSGPNTKKGQYLPTQQDLEQPVKGEIPSLATPEDTAQSYKTYIPPTEQEERKNAFDNFNANPARYGYDFEKALAETKSITQRNLERQAAYQKQEEIAVGKEKKVKGAFDEEIARLGIIPLGPASNFDPKLYQGFEKKLLNAVLSKKEGGEGLTQEQAVKKYSGELGESYRNYTNLSTLSPWSPIEFNRRVNSIQKNLSPLGQDAKRVMKDKLIEDYQVSPTYAAHKAYPIKKGELPTLDKLGLKIGQGKFGITLPKVNDITYAQLKKEMGKTHSPLSIAHELDYKKQNPRDWLRYLDNNRDDLEVWQANELDENLNLINLMDIWLKNWE